MCCTVALSNSPVFSPSSVPSPSSFRCKTSSSSYSPETLTSSSSPSSPSSPLRILRIQKPPPSNLIRASTTTDCSTCTILKRKRPTRLDLPVASMSFGNFPVTTPAGVADLVEVEGDDYSVCCKRGRKGAMEDRHSAIVNLQGDSKQGVFGIFDGHGGVKAAEFAAENLIKNIMNELGNTTTDEKIETAVRNGYLKTDTEFLNQEVRGGSCCVTALIQKGNLVVSNAGDCRAVVSRGGVAEALTSDHRPSRQDEKDRIEASGGYVDCCHGVWRIQGSLAVSRSIGDQYLKQWVTAEPETRILGLKSELEFLVLASDGLWDKFQTHFPSLAKKSNFASNFSCICSCFVSMSDDEREEKELDLTSPEVVTKYKSAAEIVNKALQLVLSECKPKAKIVDLCEKGDGYIKEQTGNMYKNVKKKIERGVAFPTCISVNNTVCHFSPLSSDETVLEEGDILKIDMGCHIDGFIAVVGHTHVLHEGPVTGRAADVIAAANTAAEVALRLVRPGKKNSDVTEAIQKVAAAYDCKIVEGVLSHQMKQFVIDGNKVVLSVSNPDTRVDEAEFEENEVYSIDIVTSTGGGKPKLDEKQTTIYKRAVDKSYNLKMKASRFIFSEISQKFPIMPFTARDLEEKRGRLGLVECVNHELLQPYPVLHEKPGDLVAHIKFTVLLMPNGSDRVTSHALQELKPTKTIEDEPEIKAWLALPVKTKKKGGGKKKKGRKGDKVEESSQAEPMEG
ncbi:hypothetical protein K7X08_006120 [Anisodus acutangulus]|uniref:ERBB-3 BINDING PROTEIN 1 n=1 Tax=Anisodus acutangulus TaxID=402998 RepID=A0A9Q1LS86_9SOLA|nr:hypothetical protein K7X08_006120 [Anisodus acutangulus]